ncbi:MAG: hypothetical protein A2Y00_02210 [Omnitrophica WOR_2 bacterium GWF2_43_52]|nr:MAG: hypothetical protein A2062_00010 [Omnitrophica WOR_2 bacterium GWA2_44_7]OGX18034.1 MAG: hypothetical protein A2Y01_04075 [Omnitrophica WOR_2 bacterium GWC2_44_8]OGX22160.1 MAG: hypothetical protein A2Y00_02210 [Omnitrophica WOR_2 bacterium GWF2_43_52]OGX54426.1 MAG: hypothetical protein A2460_01005 [Omnitrophica WOR_2 bacterium RIFOXYC2_FULL_43_9]HAH20633.1 hypothetical protein [Candidatus Omnitrophota bacterium]
MNKTLNFDFFPKEKYIVGLDIGNSSIKLAHFRADDGIGHLLAVRSIEVSKEKGACFAIKEILSGIDIPHTRFVTLLNSPQAMVKRIVVPPMPQAELKDALALEVKNYFPFPVNDCQIDFEVVGEVLEKGATKIELLLAVCPHQAIKEHIALLHQAGVNPAQIIHPSLALYNLLRRSFVKEALSFAVIDIGKIFSELVIVRDGKFVFSRKIPISGDDFTKALTATLFSEHGKIQLSYEDAERIKCDYGIPAENSTQFIENLIAISQVRFLLRPLAEKLAHEIERSFDSYQEESYGQRVEKLILMGGASRLKGLDAFLRETLELETIMYSALDGISVDSHALNEKVNINCFAGALGCGMQSPTGINLLPLEMKQAMQRLVLRGLIKAAVTGCVTLVILLFVGLRIQAVVLNKKIASAEFQLQALEREIGEMKSWGVFKDFFNAQIYGEDIMKEISNRIPDGLCLREITLNRNALEIRGIIPVAYRDKEGLLSGFIRSLEAGIFKNVRLNAISETAGVKEFKLMVELKE